jgi:hypothetical protein
LKVGRVTGPGQFFIVGDSAADLSGLTQNRLFTTATRIPVHAGDVIGLTANAPSVSGLPCDRSAPNPNSDEAILIGDPAPGSTPTSSSDFSAFELDLSAQLETDADGDGFGDETQDQCPTNASAQGTCPAAPVTPVTTVKKKKCKKHKKHRSAESAKKKKCKKKKK